MTKLFTATAACAALGLTLVSANAGTEMSSSKDKQMTAAAPAPECNWSGFYIGGSAGATGNYFDFSSSDVTVDQPNQQVGPATFGLNEAQGRDELEFIGGGQIGYLWQFNRWVVGLEIDAERMGDVSRETHIRRSSTQDSVDFESITRGRFSRNANTDWMGSGRLRVGYTFNCIMLYVTGGVAVAETSVDFRGDAATISFPGGDGENALSTGSVRSSDDNTSVGWTAGAGIEFQPIRWARLGVEYRHTEFGSDGYSFGGSNGISSSSTDVGLVNDQVVFKVNIPFAAFFGGR